jgi:hypothetical protein
VDAVDFFAMCFMKADETFFLYVFILVVQAQFPGGAGRQPEHNDAWKGVRMKTGSSTLAVEFMPPGVG